MALNWHTAGVVIYVALVVINHVGHVQSVGDDDKIKCVSKCFSIPSIPSSPFLDLRPNEQWN